LTENRVVGIVQAADGFLWVATQGGLVRFDGVRFQKVGLTGSPGLVAGTMRVLLLDRAGRIWLAKEESGLDVELIGERPPTTEPGTRALIARRFW